MGKPRFEPRAPEVDVLLQKAAKLEERIQKAGWEAPATEGFTEGPSHLEVETGGRVAHRPQYWTNQQTIKVDDIKNKGAISESSKVLDRAADHYPTSQSTLGSHEGGQDTESAALKKSDVPLGVDGEQIRLADLSKKVEKLSRRFE
tara:strand:+ start:4265 stop:4702 length:438 start_codon:yes stop_codon:yes gene_type:complete